MRNNKLLRKTLAVTMAAAMSIGCALPVFAAESKAGITKDETVYVVLNSDGSIKSQTVSDHLHSDSGLAGVADESSLQNIQNTQSAAAYTQNGTTLTWDTADTDVYYKGETTETPPITAAINYTLDGSRITADQLAGQSGHLVISIALANNTMATAEIGEGENRQTRTVCTPFAAVVGTMLSEDTFANVKADHGIVQSDGGSSIVGVATLPGVKACLNDLMPSELNRLTDYMLDTVTIEADVTNCTVPNIMIACAADASLLKDDSGDGLLGELDELDDVQQDLDKLTDAMDQLLDGAKRLNDGADDLSSGAKTLSDGTGTLLNGTTTLKDGTTTLLDGTNTLKNGTTALKDGTNTLLDGANTLDDGASRLYNGAVTLKDGTAQLRGGSATLRDGAGSLNTGLESLTGGLNTLTSKNDTLNGSAQQLADGVLALVNTALKTSGVITEDMTWASYADVLSAALGVNDEMRAQARAQIAQSVKEQTGSDLTEEQLNCLVYMTAVAMGSDGSRDLNTTVSEQGAKMNQADADAAGSIAAAQAALVNAGGNPAAIEAVQGVLAAFMAANGLPDAATAYAALAGQVNAGSDEANALTITMAALSLADGSQTDLPAALQAAGAALSNASAVQTAMATANDSGNAEAQALVTSFLTGLVTTQSADSLQQISDLNTLLSGEQALLAGLKEYTGGVATAAAGAASAKSGAAQLAAGAATLADGIVKADDGAGTLRDGLATLYGGTQNLVTGVQTLNSGATELDNGAADLNDGAARLNSGAADLNDGAAKLNDGAKTLYNGTGDLKDGTQTLYDGVNELNDEGISKLTGSVDLDSLETLKNVAAEMKDRQDGYTGYTGTPEGVATSVKFVMKTAEAPNTSTTAAATVTDTTATAQKTTLWQRILALFGLGK